MNYTKDFNEYTNIVKNTFTSSKFTLKCDKYGTIDQFSRVLRQITDLDKYIEKISLSKVCIFYILVSKKSSPFNDIHLKFSQIGSQIQNVKLYNK
jgi:hypothetical protein